MPELTIQIPRPPTTTIQQDITLEGQRRVNLIWEYTQAIIAILLILATSVASLKVVFYPVLPQQDIPNALVGFCGLVVGSYFQRTNHMNIGGVGHKITEDGRYDGR